jgi:hypothetical protein
MSNVPATSAPAGSAPAGSAPAGPQSPAGPRPTGGTATGYVSDHEQDEGGNLDLEMEAESPIREAPARREADQAPPRSTNEVQHGSLHKPDHLCSFPSCGCAPGAPLKQHPCKTPGCPNTVHHLCLAGSDLPDVYTQATSVDYRCFPCIQALIGNHVAPNPSTGAGPSNSVVDPEVFLAAAQYGAAAFVTKKQISVSLNVVFRRFSEFEITKSVYMYVLCS